MKLQFEDYVKKENAISIFTRLSSEWCHESLCCTELGYSDCADDAKRRYEFAKSVKEGIQNGNDFTGSECVKCIEMLTHLPEGFYRNKKEEESINSIIETFEMVLREESEEKIKEQDKEIINIPMTRGEAKALDDILGVLYDYILYDTIYDKLDDYELEMRDKINEIVIKYGLQKESKEKYRTDEIYRERIGKYFIHDICNIFTCKAFND